MTIHSHYHIRIRRWLALLLAIALGFQSTSCGTILHPERRGLPPGRLDPAIVALDGIGLLFFFVPGVIAFAVDFSTGAIYLPPEEFGEIPPGSYPTLQPTPVACCPSPVDETAIEAAVHRQTGKVIDLSSPEVQVLRLQSLDELPAAASGAGASPAFSVDRTSPTIQR